MTFEAAYETSATSLARPDLPFLRGDYKWDQFHADPPMYQFAVYQYNVDTVSVTQNDL